jgi:hypothetical protein
VCTRWEACAGPPCSGHESCPLPSAGVLHIIVVVAFHGLDFSGTLQMNPLNFTNRLLQLNLIHFLLPDFDLDFSLHVARRVEFCCPLKIAKSKKSDDPNLRIQPGIPLG